MNIIWNKKCPKLGHGVTNLNNSKTVARKIVVVAILFFWNKRNVKQKILTVES